MFYKKGDFGDLKGVDDISLLGTENIFCVRTWSLGSSANVKSIPGQLNLKTFLWEITSTPTSVKQCL